MKKFVFVLVVIVASSLSLFSITEAGEKETFLVYIDKTGSTSIAFTEDEYKDTSKDPESFGSGPVSLVDGNGPRTFEVYASAKVVESGDFRMYVHLAPLRSATSDNVIGLNAICNGKSYVADSSKGDVVIEILSSGDKVRPVSSKLSISLADESYKTVIEGDYSSDLVLSLNSQL